MSNHWSETNGVRQVMSLRLSYVANGRYVSEYERYSTDPRTNRKEKEKSKTKNELNEQYLHQLEGEKRYRYVGSYYTYIRQDEERKGKS